MGREEFMRRAVDLSRRGMAGDQGGPFGAVVVQDGAVVGEGCNRVTSANDPTAHAEIVAIREACARLGRFDLRGCELYTSCEPCPMCLAAAYWARLDGVWYGNSRDDAAVIGFDDSMIYREVALPLDGRALPMRRLLPDLARTVFDEWAVKPDRVPY